MRQQPHGMEVVMSAKADTAHEAALDALTEVLKDKNIKVEIRVEAAKLILNRPRFFVQDEFPER